MSVPSIYFVGVEERIFQRSGRHRKLRWHRKFSVIIVSFLGVIGSVADPGQTLTGLRKSASHHKISAETPSPFLVRQLSFLSLRGHASCKDYSPESHLLMHSWGLSMVSTQSNCFFRVTGPNLTRQRLLLPRWWRRFRATLRLST